MSAGPKALNTLDGVVVVDKPAGMTSHDVVDRVRRRFGTKRVGHAGTLDPDATGVLVVGIGRATRFLSYAQTSLKRYRARARFGISTSTQDASGDIVRTRPARFTREQLSEAMSAFVGEIEQVPPMVSAVRVGGERLYRKARRGEEVERRARRVTIEDLELIEFVPGDVPEATVDIVCSSGTYIRTLMHDIGESLGCGAHVASLRRTQAGGFKDEEAVSLDDLDRSRVRPVAEAVRFLGEVELDDEHTVEIARRGSPLELSVVAPGEAPAEGDVVSIVHRGDLIGVYRRAGARLVADRVMPS